jgi:hypothetical protein
MYHLFQHQNSRHFSTQFTSLFRITLRPKRQYLPDRFNRLVFVRDLQCVVSKLESYLRNYYLHQFRVYKCYSLLSSC